MANTFVAQGTLNRVRCSIVVPDYSNLNITPAYMGKQFATITFTGPFVSQHETATGVVNSPEPYVMASVAVGLLRTQSLGASWLAQVQDNGDIGRIVVHSDTAAFPPIEIDSTVVHSFDPGAYDGLDPVIKLNLRGVFYANNSMWNIA